MRTAIHNGEKIYVDMTSEEIWIQTTFTIETSIQKIIITMNMKVTRQIRFTSLKIILLKTLINSWNYIIHEEYHSKLISANCKTINEDDVRLSEYLHFHYIFSQFTLDATSDGQSSIFQNIPERASFFGGERDTIFNAKITAMANLTSVEELVFISLQRVVEGLSEDPKNFRWISFRELSSFDYFIQEENFENEYSCLKAVVKNHSK